MSPERWPSERRPVAQGPAPPPQAQRPRPRPPAGSSAPGSVRSAWMAASPGSRCSAERRDPRPAVRNWSSWLHGPCSSIALHGRGPSVSPAAWPWSLPSCRRRSQGPWSALPVCALRPLPYLARWPCRLPCCYGGNQDCQAGEKTPDPVCRPSFQSFPPEQLDAASLSRGLCWQPCRFGGHHWLASRPACQAGQQSKSEPDHAAPSTD